MQAFKLKICFFKHDTTVNSDREPIDEKDRDIEVIKKENSDLKVKVNKLGQAQYKIG